MKSTHDEITDMLHGYLHGTLTEETAALVKAHLLRCDECAGELFVVETLLKIEAPEPGDRYFNTLTNVVVNAARANVPKKSHLWEFFFRPIPITAAAASLCLIVYLVIVNWGGFHSKQMQYGNKMAKNITVDVSASDDIMYSLEEEYSDDFSTGNDDGDDLAVAL
ncbi:MAG: zf-HC2 domain-containing protein [Nitrospirae bacterium]|nr:zf-HC2 domain-containing protein [Nitrospirota bacterium]